MELNRPLEQIVSEISSLDRLALTSALRGLCGRVRLDFTIDFLGTQTDERLRHILLAAILSQRRAVN